MRKITIVEVWDPCEKKYVPIKQAINQGLFNTETYLFYNPEENKYYSITEAAQRGIFKSAIDLRPESLIFERVKIAETVCLISARDPEDLKIIISIEEAIKRQIVDTNLRLYRGKTEILELSNAIYKDFVQVKTLKKSTEKITETLTEKKSLDNFGLVKKTETCSTGDLHSDSMVPIANEAPSENIQQINGLYVMDIKKTDETKRIQKISEEFTAGYISEYNSNKILNKHEDSKLKSILKSGSKTDNPMIDLNEAIRQDVVFLPDSLVTDQKVKYVTDLKTGERLSFNNACKKGIVDVFNRLYVDTRDNKKISLFQALGKFYIVMKEEIYNNYGENSGVNETTNQPTLQTQRVKNSKNILTVFNPSSCEQIPLDDAIRIGLYNPKINKYIDMNTRRVISIEEAAERGLVVLKDNNEDYQFLHINGVINPVTHTEMQLPEAISSGILDYVECEVHDPASGQTLTLLEAYDKGLLITSTKNHSPISRRKFLQDPEFIPNTTRISVKSDVLIDMNNMNKTEDFKVKKPQVIMSSNTMPRKPMKANHNKMMESSSEHVLKSAYGGTSPSVANKSSQSGSESLKSQSQSPTRSSKRDKSFDLASFRGKSVDRASITSRASILSKFKEKLFGKSSKQRNFRFEQNLILDSIRILDSSTNQQHDLKTAINLNLAIPDDKIRDTQNNQELSIKEAIEKSLIRFFLSQDKVEYIYRENSYIFGNSYYLVKHVLDPNDQKKLSLGEAFNRLIVDDENSFYYGKKGPYQLENAIQKGYINCQIIDLDSLYAIIESNIFKYSTYKTPEMFQAVNGSTSIEEMIDSDKKMMETEQEKIREKTKSSDVKEIIDNEKKMEEKEQSTNRENDKISNDSHSNKKESEVPENKQEGLEENKVNMDLPNPKSRSNSKLIPKAEVMTMERFKKQKEKTAPKKKESSDEPIPKFLQDKLISKLKQVQLYDHNGFLTIEILQESGIKYRAGKNYIISHVLNEEREEYMSLKRAIHIGIIDTKSNEYINPITGGAMTIVDALKCNKIKISEYKKKSPASSEFELTTESAKNNDEIKSRSENSSRRSRPGSVNSDNQLETELRPETLSKKIRPESVYSLSVSEKQLDLEVKHEDSQNNIANEKSPVTKSIESVISKESKENEPDFSTNKLQANDGNVNTTSTNRESTSSSTDNNPGNLTKSFNFDIISILLYKKISNGRYIRFEKVVKNNLYNTETGFIEDLSTKEFISMNEAFKRGLVKINDPNILFDQSNIYKIESVLTTSGETNLADAIKKKIISRKDCTYKFLSRSYAIENAMKNGYIEGRIISSNELRCVLDDYVNYLKSSDKYPITTLDKNNSTPASPLDPTSNCVSNLRTDSSATSSSVPTTTSTPRLTPLSTTPIPRTNMNIVNKEPEFLVKPKVSDNKRAEPKSRRIRKSNSSQSSIMNLSHSVDDLGSQVNLINSNSNTMPLKKGLQEFSDFYIFDVETEMYVSLEEAFLKGIIINKPIRIIEPNSGNYISLKDAVIKGLLSCERSQNKVQPKNRSSFFTMDRVSYIIDSVLDAKKVNRCSLQDANRFGIFRNGKYRNILNNQFYSIDQAISLGYIIGKKVDLEEVENCFRKNLAVPPSKPSRGIFVEQNAPSPEIILKGSASLQNDLGNHIHEQESHMKTADYIKFISDYSLNKNLAADPKRNIGRIELVKDCKTGRFLSLEDALSAKIININKGFYLNTLSGNKVDIASAIDAGFIVLDYQASNFINKLKSRSRSLSQSSKRTIIPRNTELNDSNIIKLGRQFVITAVLDTSNKIYVELDEAIKTGIFDLNSAMYINPKTSKRYTLVDAIDQGYVKIDDENFRASYKLIIDEEHPHTARKCIKTYPLRYIVHSITKQIIPINVAYENNLVNVENGTYIGYEKTLSLKQAYLKNLALTVDDLDRPDSKRAKFKVAMVKKSTTGKNMSVKSALAKNWLNFDRRVYIDKQTNQEIPFSQAVDMDLLVLIANIQENEQSSSNTSQNGNISFTNAKNNFETNKGDYGTVLKSRSNSKVFSRHV